MRNDGTDIVELCRETQRTSLASVTMVSDIQEHTYSSVGLLVHVMLRSIMAQQFLLLPLLNLHVLVFTMMRSTKLDIDITIFSVFLDCGKDVGDVIFVIDVNPYVSLSEGLDVVAQFKLKMKFIIDIITGLKYGKEHIRIGLAFLSYTSVSADNSDKSAVVEIPALMTEIVTYLYAID